MTAIKTLALDLETFSDVDLKKSGVYPYAESPSFEILLLGYSVNGDKIQVVDIACGEAVPDEVLVALADSSVEKWAYNAQFERVCLSVWLRRNHPQYFQSYSSPEDTVGNYLDPSSWKCSRIWGAYMGLPLSLKGIGAVLKLDEQKMEEGADLIKYFCKPCRPTKSNGGRTRNLPCHAPEKWELFKSYNKRDVEVELAIKEKLAKFPVPDFVWDEYHLDQEINDRGILLDMCFVEQAIAIDAKTKQSLRSRMQQQTGLENPNSVAQMKGLPTMALRQKAWTRKRSRKSYPMRENISPMYCPAASNLPNPRSANIPPCRMPSVLTAGPGGCFNFTGPTAVAGGLGALSNCKTCPRTTWTIWRKPAPSSVTAILMPWNCSTTIFPMSSLN